MLPFNLASLGANVLLLLCLRGHAAAAPHPCEILPGKSQPWCDISLSLGERVNDLVTRIPDRDVPGLLTSPVLMGGVESLNIPKYQWWNEGLHGVGYSPGVAFKGSTPAATSFPQVVTTSMSFNVSLFHAIGQAISTEARAFNNEGHAGLTFWTPNVNIFRDPRWGRGQETPGEDPLLTTRYAVEFIKGMQDGAEDPKHLKASACLKHFTAYDLESWGGKNRHNFDALVSARDLIETYDPPFEAGVREGHASCLMCSYNSVNGVPSCANRPLLTQQAREDWGFDGYITSDCGAVMDILQNHKYTSGWDNTSLTALSAGMDSDCGPLLRLNLGHAMKDGVVSRGLVDKALSHLFRVRFRLGQFDPVASQPFAQYGPDRVNTPAHQELALEAARQGMTLLKNANDTLPFDSATVRKIAVVGPSAARTDIMVGNYFGKAPFLVSISEGLKKYGDVTEVDGCWALPEVIIDYNPRIQPSVACTHERFAKAETAAKEADATVVVVGLDSQQEQEGHDRSSLLLPGRQQELAEHVASVSKGPVVLVVMSGGAVDVSFAKDSSKFTAVLFVGYPGQAGGSAVAETIFGDNNPSGRLTQTFYQDSYIHQWKDPNASYFDMGLRPDPQGTGNPGRGYRFYTGDAVFEFGAGLSYTSFIYDSASSVLNMSGTGSLHVVVRNAGKRAGRHTVLAYAEPPRGAPADGLQRRLAKFVALSVMAPGASVTIELEFQLSDFELVTAAGARVLQEGAWRIHVGSKIIVANVARSEKAAAVALLV